jgi:hypothetical protein
MEGFVPFVFGKGNLSLFLNFADVCKNICKFFWYFPNPTNTKALVLEEIYVHYFCQQNTKKVFTVEMFRKTLKATWSYSASLTLSIKIDTLSLIDPAGQGGHDPD